MKKIKSSFLHYLNLVLGTAKIGTEADTCPLVGLYANLQFELLFVVSLYKFKPFLG